VPHSSPPLATRRRVIGYVRASSEQQVAPQVSPESQRQKLREFCERGGLELVELCEEPPSLDKSLERPGLQRALAELRRGQADLLVVSRLDRLTRSMRDLATLVDSYFLPGRHHLVAIAEGVDTRSAAGRLVLSVLGAVAQWESEDISERTSEALRQLIAQGVVVGAPAYGYVRMQQTDEHGRRRLVADEAKRKVVERMVAMAQQGLALRQICETLNREGIPAPRGGPWYPTVVRSILDREAGAAGCSKSPHAEQQQRSRQQAAQRAQALRSGDHSLRQIGRILYEEGFHSSRGGQWHASAIADLLRSAAPLATPAQLKNC
jgi:DNA invertase Pin-like site-specific DNA recombinase